MCLQASPRPERSPCLARLKICTLKTPPFPLAESEGGPPLRGGGALCPFPAMALSLRLNRSRWTCPSDTTVDPKHSGACWEPGHRSRPACDARCEQHALPAWSEVCPTAEGAARLDYPTGKTFPFRGLFPSICLFRIAERKLSNLSTWFGESEVNPVLGCWPVGASVFTWHSVLGLSILSAPQGLCL